MLSLFLSAFLYNLAFPKLNLAETAWIALVPLIARVQTRTPKRAFYEGWLCGALAYCGLLRWLIPTFQAANLSIFLALAALIALSAYLGLYWGAWTWWIAIASPRRCVNRGSAVLSGAAVWVVLEYIRTHLFSGFPWALLSDTQVHRLALIQIASFTGAYGVSFLIAWGNLAITAALRGNRRALQPIAATLIAILGIGAWQLRKANSLTTHPIKIALLQGNIDQYKKWNEAYVAEIKQTYATLLDRATAEHPDLIIWPETSVPGYLLQDPPLRLWLTGIVLKSHTSQIVGAPYLEPNNDAYNAAFAISPYGIAQARYAKQHLVPFGEVVPMQSVLGRWISVLNALGGFKAGDDSPVMTVAGVPMGMSICYEAIFPDLVRRSVVMGAQMLVNITNDGWYLKTAAPYQHLAPNVYRAIENRRWLLRADNTGVSAIIDPWGRIAAQTPIFEAKVLVGTAYPREEKTFYTRWGNVFAWGCLAIIFVGIRRRRDGR